MPATEGCEALNISLGMPWTHTHTYIYIGEGPKLWWTLDVVVTSKIKATQDLTTWFVCWVLILFDHPCTAVAGKLLQRVCRPCSRMYLICAGPIFGSVHPRLLTWSRKTGSLVALIVVPIQFPTHATERACMARSWLVVQPREKRFWVSVVNGT